MLCGYPPFNGRNDRVILDKVAAGKYAFDTDEWKPISEDAKNFIRKLLEYDPKKRISAEQAFKDPWIIQMVGNEDVDRPLAIQALSNLRTFCVSYFILLRGSLTKLISRLTKSFKQPLGLFW